MAFTGELHKVVTRLHIRSGIIDDYPVMDMHFVPPTAWDLSDVAALRAVIDDFWNTSPSGGSSAPHTYLSKEVSNGAFHDLFGYNVPSVAGPTGAPIWMDSFQTPTVGTDALPEEVAVCLSFHSSYGLDPEFGPGRTSRPRAKHRNRFYVGPLSTAAISEDSTSHRTYVSDSCQTNFTLSAKQQLQDAATAIGWLWCTFSPTDRTRETLVDGEVWMDNAFDTQRRRGPTPTHRITQSL